MRRNFAALAQFTPVTLAGADAGALADAAARILASDLADPGLADPSAGV